MKIIGLDSLLHSVIDDLFIIFLFTAPLSFCFPYFLVCLYYLYTCWTDERIQDFLLFKSLFNLCVYLISTRLCYLVIL